jgi:hypothetical protein
LGLGNRSTHSIHSQLPTFGLSKIGAEPDVCAFRQSLLRGVSQIPNASVLWIDHDHQPHIREPLKNTRDSSSDPSTGTVSDDDVLAGAHRKNLVGAFSQRDASDPTLLPDRGNDSEPKPARRKMVAQVLEGRARTPSLEIHTYNHCKFG